MEKYKVYVCIRHMRVCIFCLSLSMRGVCVCGWVWVGGCLCLFVCVHVYVCVFEREKYGMCICLCEEVIYPITVRYDVSAQYNVNFN